MLLSMLSSNCSICHMIISTKETQLRQEQGTGGSRRPPQIPVSVRGRIKCGVTSLIQSSTDASGAVQHLSYSPPDGDGGLRKTEYPPGSSLLILGARHWPSSLEAIAIGLLAEPRDTDNQMFTWTGSRYTQRLFFPIILSYSGGSLSGFAWEMTVVSVFIANFAL